MNSKAVLRFPKPPFRIDQSLLVSPPAGPAIATYLEQIRAWRSAVLEFLETIKLGTALDAQSLSTRAQSALATFLNISWSEQMSRYALQHQCLSRAGVGACWHSRSGGRNRGFALARGSG